MVNGIDTNIVNNMMKTQAVTPINTTNAVQKVAEQIPDTFTKTVTTSFKDSMLWNGIPLVKYFKNAKKSTNIITSAGKIINSKEVMTGFDKKILDSFKNIIKGKDGTIFSRIGKFIKTSEEVQGSYSNLKSAVKATKKATKLITKANSAEKLESVIKSATDAADIFVDAKGAKLKTLQEQISNIGKQLESAPGNKKLAKELQKATKQLQKAAIEETGKKGAGKLSKFMKNSGAKGMLIISGIIEVFTEVGPTFMELGVKKGLKQTAKSAVKVISDTFGYAAGSQIGAAAGSAAGAFVSAKVSAMIGSAFCPGLGTALGALFGFAGGLIGSWVLGKATKKITGKTEREIAKEQQEQNQQQFQQDNKEELIQANPFNLAA